jgi:hypothetical protein
MRTLPLSQTRTSAKLVPSTNCMEIYSSCRVVRNKRYTSAVGSPTERRKASHSLATSKWESTWGVAGGTGYASHSEAIAHDNEEDVVKPTLGWFPAINLIRTLLTTFRRMSSSSRKGRMVCNLSLSEFYHGVKSLQSDRRTHLRSSTFNFSDAVIVTKLDSL